MITPEIPKQEDINQDFGLGSRVTQESHTRFLNRDGGFNVERHGLPFFGSQNVYHKLLTMSWIRFILLIIVYYLLTNALFSVGYVLCGEGALEGIEGKTIGERFLDEYFFSVQTLATIGYGRISPHGLAANILVTIEALAGLLGFALATGLLFARFSRPSARILFSNQAVIAPYENGSAFMFRIANQRSNQLIEVEATVSLSRYEIIGGKRVRKFHSLALERQKVVFMPLHWVIVHPIDEASPLFGRSQNEVDASDPEFVILLTATDETFSQTVHARSSYKHDEVLWNVKFADMYVASDNGKLGIDMRRLHLTEQVSRP